MAIRVWLHSTDYYSEAYGNMATIK